jgi:hypothetical protein
VQCFGRWGVAWSFALAGCVAAGSTGPVAREVEAWPIGTVAIELAPEASLEIETRHPSAGARPVLHLWDAQLGREVAQASGSAWFSHAARLRYRNAAAQVRRYELLVRAYDDDSRGTVDLDRAGRPWLQGVLVGGTHVALPLQPGLVYQAAAVPAGARAARLLLLDGAGHLLARDDASGPTGLPRLAYAPNARAIVVASRDDAEASSASRARAAPATSRGNAHGLPTRSDAPDIASPARVSVYANDPNDRDGDGLGQRLERALGTCDSPSDRACRRSLLADYYRGVANATRDTDRDGISDADELFGLSAPLLDLPRFGADPRHKDVFVEVDHDPRLPELGFSERDFVEIAALFAQGSARALRNPDQRPGVHLHIDSGFAPQDRAHAGLLGDYGGSGSASASDYRSARKRDFSPSRHGYFRYAFSTPSGRGQASGDAFTVNRDLSRVTIFAHELGHTLGLAHHGHASWGAFNCKPNYFSIMNYLYQSQYQIGFSRGAAAALDPSAVFERAAVRGVAAAVLREPPLELDVRGHAVDWNRDGVISDVAVRADLLWATYKSCGAAEQGSLDLASGELAASTPVLLRARGQLLALWVESDGRLAWRHAANGTDAATWTPTEQVGGLVELRHIAGLTLANDDVALASVRADGSLHLGRLHFEDEALRLVSDRELAGGGTEHEPSLSWLSVDERYYGTPQVLGLWVRSSAADGGVLQFSLAAPESVFVRRPVIDAAGQAVLGAGGPTVLALPNGTAYAVFADSEHFLHVFRYEPDDDRWRDLTQFAFAAALGPRSYGRAGLAFHRYRAADGGELGGGALYLSFSEPESSAARYPDNPHLFVSEALPLRPDAPQLRASTPLSLRWRGALATEWSTLAAGSGVALLEDDETGQLRGLIVLRDDRAHARTLQYLPHVDGEVPLRLGSGDDFEVMERAICTGIRGEAQCGDQTTGAY